MNIDELYREITSPGSPLCYPFCYDDKDFDYLAYVDSLVELYLEEVAKLDEESLNSLNHVFDDLPQDFKPSRDFDFKRDVRNIANLVLDVLQTSFKCYHEEAYEKLKSFFIADRFFYLGMLPQLEVDDRSGCFYRIRQDKIDLSKGDGELFHIPFDKRHLVSAQRYSIPGYPALYLGGDFFTSWCEMNRPKLEGLSYAKFKFKKQFRFLDLGLPYKEDSTLWEKYSLCAMYPLLMACMVRVKFANAAFKPEYLMPQMMMKLVRDNGAHLQGIAYMSNKMPTKSDSYSRASRNLVVCVYNTLCKSGYDKDLASKMQMTKIKFVTKEQVDEAIVYDRKIYTINFSSLVPADDDFHDIDVPMVLQ